MTLVHATLIYAYAHMSLALNGEKMQHKLFPHSFPMVVQVALVNEFRNTKRSLRFFQSLHYRHVRTSTLAPWPMRLKGSSNKGPSITEPKYRRTDFDAQTETNE